MYKYTLKKNKNDWHHFMALWASTIGIIIWQQNDYRMTFLFCFGLRKADSIGFQRANTSVKCWMKSRWMIATLYIYIALKQPSTALWWCIYIIYRYIIWENKTSAKLVEVHPTYRKSGPKTPELWSKALILKAWRLWWFPSCTTKNEDFLMAGEKWPCKLPTMQSFPPKKITQDIARTI